MQALANYNSNSESEDLAEKSDSYAEFPPETPTQQRELQAIRSKSNLHNPVDWTPYLLICS